MKKASMRDVLDADKTSLYRSAGHTVRCESMLHVHVQPKSQMTGRGLKRAAKYLKGCPDTGIMFEVQTAPGRLTVQSDSDWAGDKSTRKSVSAGNIRYGQHLFRSWSKDHTVMAMELHAACVAAQEALGTEIMARELGVRLDAMELQAGANAAIGTIGRQGWGKLRHLDLSNLWLQSVVRGKHVNLKKVQSESNMADLGTMTFEKDKNGRHMKNLGSVRFDWNPLRLSVKVV